MPIQLISPINGCITKPLQEHEWASGGTNTGHATAEPNWQDLAVYCEDRSFPRPLKFQWEADDDELRYDLIVSPSANLDEAHVFSDLANPSADIWHLFIATQYFWKVIARKSGQKVAESAIEMFYTNPTAPRWIGVPGITNVRDLGGWPLPNKRRVKQGIFYRSSEMNSHVEIQGQGVDILTNHLGVRTDLDLRGKAEQPAPALDERRVKWVNVPIWPYAHIVTNEGRQGYRRVFGLLAERKRHPVIFHCWGGADRAGTVAFLLNALLGVDEEDLFTDFELTSMSVWGERSRSMESFQNLLAALADYGDSPQERAENYLLEIGVQDAEIASIRMAAIVPCSMP